jgi:hypothetical protein
LSATVLPPKPLAKPNCGTFGVPQQAKRKRDSNLDQSAEDSNKKPTLDDEKETLLEQRI